MCRVALQVLLVVAVSSVCDVLGTPFSGKALETTLVRLQRDFEKMRLEMKSIKGAERADNAVELNTQRLSKRESPAPSSPNVPPWGPASCQQGSPGRDGRDGRDGQPGNTGPPGQDGLTPEQLEEVLKKVLEAKAKPVRTEGGAVYIRWGRKKCPPKSELMYDGYAAGSHYTHKGGGADRLCLPKDPQWGKIKAGNQGSSYIYGAELEVSVFDPFSHANAGGHALHDSDVLCAVCLAKSRHSHVMIPAKKECPVGWTMEYNGYLMAEHYNHVGKSSWDCMDNAPDVGQGGTANLNGALFYVVEAHCGALPCPPYTQGNELTCVVCTK